MTEVMDTRGKAGETVFVADSAGILYRVSSGGQDEENQVPELERHCYDKSYRINKRYQLHDKSAFHSEHVEDLEKILYDIRTGVISVVVIVHSSRIDRRDPDIAEFYHLSIRMAGGRIESVREPLFGKTDLAGRMTTMLALEKNHDYSVTLSGHIRPALDLIKQRRTEGKGFLGRAPFGYEIVGEKKQKVIVPTALGLEYLPLIYEHIAGGDSLRLVADWLNAEGVPTGCKINKKGQPTKGWTAATVGHVVHNTVYKGQLRNEQREYVGPCTPIISVALWQAVQDRLNRVPKRGLTKMQDKALLSSRLWCVKCKSPKYRVRAGGGNTYYRCSGKLAANGKSCVMIVLSVVDALVDEALSADDTPIMALTLVPGANYDYKLDLNRAELNALDPDSEEYDYDARHAELMAERKRLRDLDTTPDEWKETPTGETYGGKWNAADLAGKREILLDVEVFSGKNDDGEAFVIVDIMGQSGLVRRHIAGNPPGQSLLARAGEREAA